MNNIFLKLWTSDLDIQLPSNEKIFNVLDGLSGLISVFKYEEKLYSKFKNENVVIKKDSRLQKYLDYEGITSKELNSFCNYSNKFDVTGLMKGYALSVLRSYLFHYNSDKFLINFGGDIVASNWDKIRLIINPKSDEEIDTGIDLCGNFSVFTSSNKSKRGNHIKNVEGKLLTVTTYKSDMYNLIRSDMYTTQLVAGKVTIEKPLVNILIT